MERKAMKKQLKLAACFFLLTVLLRGAVVEACQQEDEDCSSLECCSGLECVETSTGVFQCEPACCEPHADHWCKVHERECCDENGVTCECDVDEGTCKSYTKQLGEVCDTSTDKCARRAVCQDVNGTNKCKCNDACTDDCDCCVNAVCNNGNCVCNKQEDDPCDPSACVPECCERQCVQVAVGDFRCKL